MSTGPIDAADRDRERAATVKSPRDSGSQTVGPSEADLDTESDCEFSLDGSLVSWDGSLASASDASPRDTLKLGDGFAPPSGGSWVSERPRPHRDFGRYRLLEEIGRGGMGVVYKARQHGLDRLVAIKMILASHMASADQVERFYAEARAAARVQHPHIVVIHEVGQIQGQHYFAMEYMAGASLTTLLKAGPLDPVVAARHVLTVANAVEHLHAQGIVHRDLKPSNILLDEAGQPAVTDFGLAKMLAGEGGKTLSGAIVGTPSYMAPEQAAGRGDEVGICSDVYSLGAILYELLTGRPPFVEENPMETLVQVLEGEPPRPRRLRPDLPRALESICLKCLEKAPDDRYPSAAALAQDLGRFLTGDTVEARHEGAWHRLRRWSRREPALASRLGTMALCGAIIEANDRLLAPTLRETPRLSIAVVLGWALASMVFQAMMRKERWADLGRYAWAWADIVLFTVLVLINDGLKSSQVAGYFLLVSASGLWFRERLVWFTTFMAVAAYGVLVLIETWRLQDVPESPYRHVVFATVLAVSGLIITYQVKRVRALSHYYEHRPLP